MQFRWLFIGWVSVFDCLAAILVSILYSTHNIGTFGLLAIAGIFAVLSLMGNYYFIKRNTKE